VTTAHPRVWFEQAEADLRAAVLSTSGGAHEWACFQSQQAGEKALNDSGDAETCVQSARSILERVKPFFAR
jgi:HEPN domain-containing protein